MYVTALCLTSLRECRLLVSTKCAGMGSDIPDIRLSITIGGSLCNTHIAYTPCLPGLPGDSWELSQQAGRVGRDGRQGASVVMVWPGQTGGSRDTAGHSHLIDIQ
jgi:superfamily II DNA helicase RecQ